MSNIYEEEFNTEDPNNKGYSMLEYDLYAKLGLTMRKNLKTGYFEIVRMHDRTVAFAGTLEEMVRMANQLERAENTKIVYKHRKV